MSGFYAKNVGRKVKTMDIKINEQLDSCSIKINAKGKWSGEIKVYADDAVIAFQKATSLAHKLEEIIFTKNNEIQENTKETVGTVT